MNFKIFKHVYALLYNLEVLNDVTNLVSPYEGRTEIHYFHCIPKSHLELKNCQKELFNIEDDSNNTKIFCIPKFLMEGT